MPDPPHEPSRPAPDDAPLAGPGDGTMVATLLAFDIVGSTDLVRTLGDALAAERFAAHDRLARDLLSDLGGWEIDRTDGLLVMFRRPAQAVAFALAHRAALDELGPDHGPRLRVRTAIHLGEIVVRRNDDHDVARGAKAIEVEGLAKPMVARLVDLAGPDQVLLTRTAFDLARRASVGTSVRLDDLVWMAHGRYRLKGLDEPAEVFEVGRRGAAPLLAPADTATARRVLEGDERRTLGWRPGIGLPVPNRPVWILRQRLGDGGPDEVWLAANADTGQCRVFKFCFDVDRVERLRRELAVVRLLGETLGDRPDIARLHEVQLDEPPFHLECEWTEAGHLRQWAESRGGIDRVPLEQRIEIVVGVARAAAAAHSVGIVHADIRPETILMSSGDHGNPRPKLADFGISRIVESPLASGRTDLDRGAEPPGRAAASMYAPPEALGGAARTVQGDVHALGVLLWQMVVGDLSRPLAHGWERHVADPLLREDIARCVDGQPDRRLGSARELVQRIEQRDQRRRARRRRRLGRAAVAASAVLLLLLGAASAIAVREIHLRRLAEDRERLSEELNRYLVDLISSPDMWAEHGGRDVRVVDVLDAFSARLPETCADQPAVRANLHVTLGRSYKVLGDYEPAREQLEQAVELGRALGPAHERLTAGALHEHGAVLWHLQRFQEAVEPSEQALAIRRRLVERARGDDRISAQLEVALTLNQLGACLDRLGRSAAAEDRYRSALEIRRRLLPADHRDVLFSMNNLGTCLRERGAHAEAEALGRAVLAALEARSDGTPDAGIASSLGNVGKCLLLQASLEEAAAILERSVTMKRAVFGDDHPRLAIGLHDLGLVRLRLGRFAAAADAFDGALAIRADRLPPDDPRTAFSAAGFGTALLLGGDEIGRGRSVLDAALDRLDASAARTATDRTAVRWMAEALESIGEGERAERLRSRSGEGRNVARAG